MQPIELVLTHIESLFLLKVANISRSPVRVWSTNFSYGFEAYYFRVWAQSGRECLIRRKPVIWTANIPEFVTIEPGLAHSERFALNDSTWDTGACGPDLAAGSALTAVMEIAPDENAAAHSVITGHYESNRVHLHFMREV